MHLQRVAVVVTVVNCVVLVALLLGSGPATSTNSTDVIPPSVVRAQAIELVDSAGNVRAQLYLADGAGAIRLRDASGEVRVKIQATDEGAGLLFLDGNTEPAVQLGTTKAGSSLKLIGANDQERLFTP